MHEPPPPSSPQQGESFDIRKGWRFETEADANKLAREDRDMVRGEGRVDPAWPRGIELLK
jgi:hypothetical protein